MSIQPDKAKIPGVLKDRVQWVAWRLVKVKGEKKPKKVPYQAKAPKRQASTTNPKTWGTFEEALQAYHEHNFDGVGFVFPMDDPFTGVDLDKCRNTATGELEPWAQRIVEQLDSYCEVSPSGTGLHIIVKGALPKEGRKKGDVETYESGRYFTMTGQHMADTPLEVCERQDELNQLHADTFQTAKPDTQHPIHGKSPQRASLSPLDDTALIQKAMRAGNGAKFSALWNGDISAHTSASEADLAFCSLLAFLDGRGCSADGCVVPAVKIISRQMG